MLLTCVAGLNWLVNPFSVFDPPPLPRINVNKPGYIEHLRLTHAHRVTALAPNCVLIGTSRTGRGLRPDHPAFADLDCYNLALPAIGMYEMRRYLQHAQATRPLKLAILGIDFRVMNSPADDSGAFVETRLAVDAQGRPQGNRIAPWGADMAATLLSFNAVAATLDAVRRHDWIKDSLRRDGFWAQLDDTYDHSTGFDAYSRNTLNRFAAVLRGGDAFRGNLEQFRLLVRDAHVHRIDLRIHIPPSHAWHWQALWESGLWPKFEAMKEALVTLNEEEAQRAGRPPFPLWDFSGSEGPALEPVPTDMTEKMTWFWEPVHFKSTLGDRVIDRVMAGEQPEMPPGTIGQSLRAETLGMQLERLRALQHAFGTHNPEVVAHLQSLAPPSIMPAKSPPRPN